MYVYYIPLMCLFVLNSLHLFKSLSIRRYLLGNKKPLNSVFVARLDVEKAVIDISIYLSIVIFLV